MEKALIVGLKTLQNKHNFDNSISELKNLTHTSGAKVSQVIVQERKSPDPATYIGKGKAAEIGTIIKEDDIGLIIFDHELTSTQLRNLENITDTKVVDRTALILDIFSRHAYSKEGKLQVELAQYNYYLPRLTRLWTHLSRLGGGIGTRGPGETQLEVDRRRIQLKISNLKKQLKKMDKIRRTQRQSRKRSGALKIVLVGYTNSGKSSLINALTKAEVKVEDQLFSTLDPTSRRLYLNGKNVVITDTVGFIDNLPHELIEAFKSTLEEVTEADLLLNVADCSVENLEERLDVVSSVLEQIGANSHSIKVFNKIDILLKNEVEGLKKAYPDAVFISALKGEGIEELREKIIASSELRMSNS